MPTNSVIAIPQSGETLELSSTGTFEVKGYALPYGDQGPVVRVEVSTDNGHTRGDAEILVGKEQHNKWCCSLWRSKVHIEKGKKRRVLSRATDNGGNVQNPEPLWNLRGVGYDGLGESRDLGVL